MSAMLRALAAAHLCVVALGELKGSSDAYSLRTCRVRLDGALGITWRYRGRKGREWGGAEGNSNGAPRGYHHGKCNGQQRLHTGHTG